MPSTRFNEHLYPLSNRDRFDHEMVGNVLERVVMKKVNQVQQRLLATTLRVTTQLLIIFTNTFNWQIELSYF